MITEAETTRALATTCGGRPLQEGPPWPPLLGNVCAVSSPQPARLPGLCHAGGTGLGLPGQCSHVLSCPSSAWKSLRVSSSGLGHGQLSGEMGAFSQEWPLALRSANSKNSIEGVLKNSRKGFLGFFGVCFWLFCCWGFFKPPSSLRRITFSARK